MSKFLGLSLAVVISVGCAEFPDPAKEASAVVADYRNEQAITDGAYQGATRASPPNASTRYVPTEAPVVVASEAPPQSAPVPSPIEKWKTGVAADCAFAMNLRYCDATSIGATEDDVKECKKTCLENISAAVDKKLEDAGSVCLGAYVNSNGKQPAVCDIRLPATFDAHGDGTAPGIETANAECAKACKKKGDEDMRNVIETGLALNQSEKLQLGYKRCMLAVDSTREARRYWAYDRSLYYDLIRRADADCRTKFRCEWLEAHTHDVCDYGN